MSKLVIRTIEGKDGLPVAFPTGILLGAATNNIGVPGGQGFGVGICPALPAGMTQMAGTTDPAADNYGNYTFSDGSVMAWIPAFFYKYGTGANGFAVNVVDIKPAAYFTSVAGANSAGYALHRAFYDAGLVQTGFFIDKYLPSLNGAIASSLKNGAALSSAVRGSLASAHFSHCTGNSQTPADAYYGAVAVAKSRGNNFFPASMFQRAALALLALAHGQASTSTAWCAWWVASGVSAPRGCNNNALGDYNDAAILYTTDGNGTYAGCGQTGSANYFSRTTHNGQACGVADLNGLLWEISPGLTVASDVAKFYILKTTAQMKAMTSGTGGGVDLWGTEAQLLAAGYEELGATYGALAASSSAKLFGAAAQVFGESVVSTPGATGLVWQATGAGIPLVGGVGGTNPFGNDGLWDYRPSSMCPIAGGGWDTAAYAGVWALYLPYVRDTTSNGAGCRAALYL